MAPVLPPRTEKRATLALAQSIPGIKVYGLLLCGDGESSAARMVRRRWSELHHLSGDEVLLMLFQPLPEWTQSFRAYWKRRIGVGFDKIWAEWRRSAEPGASYQYGELFKPRITASEFPCLALFTDAREPQAVIRPIPDWHPDDLYHLFVGVIEALRECASAPPTDRLHCVRGAVTTPSARASAYLGHVGRKASKYLSDHPARTVVMTTSLVVALATANVLPLAPAALAALTSVKNALR